MGIEILLNIMFIVLQDGRERNQKGLSKQNASATPPLVKGTQWAQKIQDFKEQIKMPLKGRSQKGIFPIVTGTANVQKTPPGGIKSIHNVPPYNMINHQPLYLKKSLYKKLVKIKKDLTVKLRHSKAKKAIKNLIIRFTAKDQ